MENKKGQTSGLAGLPLIIITLILAAFILVLGLQIQSGITDTTDNLAGSVVNESGYVNASGYTLAQAALKNGFNSPVITLVLNGTTGITIPSTNYTLVGNRIYNTTIADYKGANISYSYQYGSESFTASNKTSSGVATFADYWELIVLAIVIGIVVSLLLVIFNKKRTK